MTHHDERRAPFPPLWPELAEREERQLEQIARDAGLTITLPTWRVLQEEAAATRARYVADPDAWARVSVAKHYRTYGTGAPYLASEFDLRNIEHFQHLPSVDATKRAIVKHAAQSHVNRVVQARPGVTRAELEEFARSVASQVQAEQSHMMYHKAMWRAHGRRIFVLDDTMYALLAGTPLPKLPVSILSSPHHSFYVKLPTRAFVFGVRDERTQRVGGEYVEGVMVGIDKIDPDYAGQREVALMTMSEGQGGGLVSGTTDSDNRNCAFISVRLGADAMLDEITFDGGVSVEHWQKQLTMKSGAYAPDDLAGAHELGVVLPRVVFGLLLYMACEHPDIVPVPPAPRRTFADIRSPKQRAAALANQAAKLKGTTSLPVYYVGGRVADDVARERARVEQEHAERTGRKLDHPVWVRGHWRQQAHGANRALRRTMWIRPHLRGPDVDESLTIRAARVQRAMPNPAPSHTSPS